MELSNLANFDSDPVELSSLFLLGHCQHVLHTQKLWAQLCAALFLFWGGPVVGLDKTRQTVHAASFT